ncbi:MAG: Ig-like domain-containing protein [Eubacterium sp.]|nr:Ig-like domain-containing protein [Eubacterium sp.]
MKHVKRVIAVIVALAVAVGFMPAAPVNAEATPYGVWVNGIQFDSDNLTIACGEGTAEYDATTNTLTLNNAEINTAVQKDFLFEGFKMYCLIYCNEKNLNIKLQGKTILDGTTAVPESTGIYGILALDDVNVKISGPGTLEIKNTSGGIYVGHFENFGSLAIENADITVSAKNSSDATYRGIDVNGALSIIGCTINISSPGTMGGGINVYSPDMVTIKDSNITISSTENAIEVGDSEASGGGLTIDNCTVNLTSTEKYGINLVDTWFEDGTHAPTRKLIVKNGGSLTIDSGTDNDGNDRAAIYPDDSTYILIPSDSVFSNEEGYGSGFNDNKIKITIGTNPVNEEGGATPTPTPSPSATPTPGGDNTPSPSATPTPGGNGDGNGNGDGSGSNVPRDQQKGEDGTELGKGAAAEQVDKFLTAYDSEADAPGTLFRILQAKSTKTTKNSITVTWKKAPGAVKYLVYASKCGKGNKPIKMDETTKTKYTLKKLNGKKISKGTYYKFIIVAVDSNNNVVSSSKTIHSATLGGKVGNCKSISTKAKKNKVSLKAKKTFKLKPKQKAQKKLKIKNHRKLMYESSDETVATVNKSGVIKAVGKGNCEVFVYAQNGVFQKIKVTVK